MPASSSEGSKDSAERMLMRSNNSTMEDNTRGSVNAGQQDFVCAFYNPEFIIYSSIGSFYIPCVVMIVLYFRIFKELHSRASLAKKKKMTSGDKSNRGGGSGLATDIILS